MGKIKLVFVFIFIIKAIVYKRTLILKSPFVIFIMCYSQKVLIKNPELSMGTISLHENAYWRYALCLQSESSH